MVLNRVLSIRISGKKKKESIRRLFLDLAHFKNLWIILIKRYKELYGYYPTDQSILYGLIADKNYSSKKEKKLKRFKEVKESILKDEKLKDVLTSLKEQKRKVDNNYLLQQVIREIIKSFKSYRKAYKEYVWVPDKFKGIPKPPKAKKLKFLMNFSVELNTSVFKQINESILIRLRIKKKEFLKIKLPEGFSYEIKSIRLKLFGTDIYADVVYKIKVLDENRAGEYIASIDLGLNNLVALISTNPEFRSFLVSGKEIKSFNQWFNKEKSKLQSEIDTLKNRISQTKDKEETKSLKQLLTEKLIKFKELSAYRKRRLNNDFHKIARKIIELLKATNHKKLYIGKGATESKNGINIGKKNNQHFVSIPFRRFIELIKYKAEEAGIEVVEKDEAFTSKTSPLADIFEVRKTGEKYLQAKKREDKELVKKLSIKLKKLTQAERGYKKCRGLVKDKISNKLFNADLVGSYNIARVGENSPRLIKDLKLLFIKLCNPVKYKLIDFLYKVSPESLLIGIRSSSSLLSRVDSSDYQRCNNLTIF